MSGPPTGVLAILVRNRIWPLKITKNRQNFPGRLWRRILVYDACLGLRGSRRCRLRALRQICSTRKLKKTIHHANVQNATRSPRSNSYRYSIRDARFHYTTATCWSWRADMCGVTLRRDNPVRTRICLLTPLSGFCPDLYLGERPILGHSCPDLYPKYKRIVRGLEG